MAFLQLAAKIANNGLSSFEKRTCPDQYVGIISAFDATTKDFPVRLPLAKRPDGLQCVIIILESPHKDEFKNEIGPAKGKTGVQIRKWIDKVNGLSGFREYGLILVNAVQHQCSLGRPTKVYRDKLFTLSWHGFGENDFVQRLKDVYREGDIIVNCCTKGNSPRTELRRLVHQAVIQALPRVLPLNRAHPYSWFSTRNREATW